MSEAPSNSLDFTRLQIHGRSIVLDHQAQMRRFVKEYGLETHHFFSRLEEPVAVFADPETSYADYFRALWPGVPPIQVGSLQIPLGFSRYSRGLFALDRESFLAIAQDAWGWEPENPNDLSSITDAPGLWGTENASLQLALGNPDAIDGNASYLGSFQMYALPPLRITADSLELIALPLVDIRWFWQHTYATTQPSIESWLAFFEALRTQLPLYSSLGFFSFPDNFRELTCETLPDIALRTTTVPIVRLLDAAAHSLGMRGFVNHREGSSPRWGFAYPPAAMQKFYQQLQEADFKIAGGKPGSAGNYGYLRIHGRRVSEGIETNRRNSVVSSHFLPDGANSLFTRSLFTSYKVDSTNSEEAEYFTRTAQWIAKTQNECKGDGVYLTFGGRGLLFEDFDALCGLDYIEQIFDQEGEATWISHFVGLPSGWQSQAILLQPSPPTTTTTTSPIQTSPCSGKCSWVSNDGFAWSLVSNNCSPASATTTTASAGSTTSTTTSTTLPAICPRRPSLTTTTPSPNTCSCLPPQFCPVAVGDCMETSCSTAVGSVTQCPGTTTSTTASGTTTTCDCNTTTTISPSPGCGGGCTWILLGNGTVLLLQNNCALECPCTYPGGAGLCQTVTSPCNIPPPPPPPPPPVPCTGTCEYVCVGNGLGWSIIDQRCSGTLCRCIPPSDICNCGQRRNVPCVSPPTATTSSTTPAGSSPVPCGYGTCYPTTTSTTGITTTPNPCPGPCRYRWNTSTQTWQLIVNGCGLCGCIAPPTEVGTSNCDVRAVGCNSSPTTTTLSPTTTTTTVMGACCYPGPVGGCVYPVSNAYCAAVGGTFFSGGNCAPGLCTGGTTTTSSTTTTTTTTSTTTTTTTTPCPCPFIDCGCVGGLPTPADQCAYGFVWSCAVCNCVPTSTTTTTTACPCPYIECGCAGGNAHPLCAPGSTWSCAACTCVTNTTTTTTSSTTTTTTTLAPPPPPTTSSPGGPSTGAPPPF